MARISLDGLWRLKDTAGRYDINDRVPGLVQESFVDNDIMPDPYRGSNEELFKALEDKDWVCEREFFVEDEISGIIELVFEGIDTLAEVYLNDVFIGKCEDMFLTYRFDVRKILKNGKNNLRVVIRSPVREPEKLERAYGELNAAEEKVRGYIRKAQYSYGWDWGLRLAVRGYGDLFM